jgi:hypothetical protein
LRKIAKSPIPAEVYIDNERDGEKTKVLLLHVWLWDINE